MSKRLDAVTIPKWGIEMTEGTIVAWHKEEGDTVKAGEEIVDIETDKIVNSFEARSQARWCESWPRWAKSCRWVI